MRKMIPLHKWREIAESDPWRALRHYFLFGVDLRGGGLSREDFQPEVSSAWRTLSNKSHTRARALELLPAMGPGERRLLADDIGAAWECLAEENPLEALRLLDELNEKEIRFVRLRPGDVWLKALAAKDYQSFFWLGVLPVDERLRIRPEILAAWRKWSEDDPMRAIRTYSSLDSAEQAELQVDIASVWLRWGNRDPAEAISALGALQEESRRAVSPVVPIVWEKALLQQQSSESLKKLTVLLPSERAALSQKIIEFWRRQLSSNPEIVLSNFHEKLDPEEYILLTEEIQEAWRRCDDPARQLEVLQEFSVRMRAGLAHEVPAVWWKLADVNLDTALNLASTLNDEEREGLPHRAAMRAFADGKSLPQGTLPVVEEDVRSLWRRLKPDAALEWLSWIEPGLRELISVKDCTERWIECMLETPGFAIEWLRNVPQQLHPTLDQEAIQRLLSSDNAEARLWVISRLGSEEFFSPGEGSTYDKEGAELHLEGKGQSSKMKLGRE